MKKLLLAATSLIVAQPAHAALNLNLDATLPITTVTYYNPVSPSYPSFCTMNAVCSTIETAVRSVHFSVVQVYVNSALVDSLAAGQQFQFQGLGGRSGASGSAIYLGSGLFQPVGLMQYIDDSGAGCYFTCSQGQGSTTSFTLTDPNNPAAPAVPEPATWATLLLGLFATAGALRWRPRMAYA